MTKEFSKTFAPKCYICGEYAEFVDRRTVDMEYICKDHTLEHVMRKNNLI